MWCFLNIFYEVLKMVKWDEGHPSGTQNWGFFWQVRPQTFHVAWDNKSLVHLNTESTWWLPEQNSELRFFCFFFNICRKFELAYLTEERWCAWGLESLIYTSSFSDSRCELQRLTQRGIQRPYPQGRGGWKWYSVISELKFSSMALWFSFGWK